VKRWKVTYRPFPQSDITSSDVVIDAEDEKDCREQFKARYPMWIFVSAKEE
jgi:hypothetical protein